MKPVMPQKDQLEGFIEMAQMKYSKAEALMLQPDGIADTPGLDFDAWRAVLRSNCGGEVKVTAPNAFDGWMRPLSVCGLAAAAVKIQWGTAGWLPGSPALSGYFTMFPAIARTVRAGTGESALSAHDPRAPVA
jgi:hypothetical protein